MWGRWWWWREEKKYQKRSGLCDRCGSSFESDEKELNSHNNGSPIRLVSHHKKKSNDDASIQDQHISFPLSLVSRNEMNISTSFICFHFILVSSPHSAFLDDRSVLSVGLSIVNLSTWKLYVERASPSTHLQFNPSWADVSSIYRNYLLMSCCVLLKQKRRKKKKTRNESKKRKEKKQT